MKAVLGSLIISHLLLFAVFIAEGCDPSSTEDDVEETGTILKDTGATMEEAATEEEGEEIVDASHLPAACVDLSKLCDLCS